MGLYEKISPVFNYEISEFDKSLVLFDPTDVYSRININPYSRRQSLSMGECFPQIDKNLCACGCGNKLPKRATRWYHPDHAELLAYVMKIIQGDSDLVRRVMRLYKPYECALCGKADYLVERWKNSEYNGRPYISYSASGIHVDHIIAVKNGGGGCWLGNYQFLCHKCNILKDKKVPNTKMPPLPLSNLF